MDDNIWEVRRNGVVVARSSLEYCGYNSLTVKALRSAGYAFYVNGERVGR